MVLTAVYTVGVIIRCKTNSHRLKKMDDRVMGRDEDEQRQEERTLALDPNLQTA